MGGNGLQPSGVQYSGVQMPFIGATSAIVGAVFSTVLRKRRR